MLKRHVLYIFIASAAAILLVLLWIYFGAIFGINASSDSTDHLGPPTNGVMLKCNYNIDDYNAIIKSITRTMEFFQLFLEDLVVDAAVGMRALQGQLQIILHSFSLPEKIRTRLEQMLTNVTAVGDRTVEHFVDVTTKNEQSPDGKERLRENLHWIQNGSLWEMPTAGDWQAKDDLNLKRYNVRDDNTILFSNTNFSDRCIGKVFDNCAVPEVCFTKFLGKRYSEYLITHAMLFLLFAKKKNCFDDHEYMEKITKFGDPSDIMASFCAKIFLEAQVIDMAGFNVGYRDLFSEQVLVCSLSGYQQFLEVPWLRAILSWQSKQSVGCFELPHIQNSKTFAEIYGIKKGSGRAKRHEHMISTGTQTCSTHFSGVAVACIGIHLRYLVESCPEMFSDI